jgi:hypothetical protein
MPRIGISKTATEDGERLATKGTESTKEKISSFVLFVPFVG